MYMYFVIFISIVVSIAFVSFLAKRKNLLLSVGLCFLVELLWALISCAYIDYVNPYISETGITSYHTGAFIRMLLLFLPYILLISSKKNSPRSWEPYNKRLVFKKVNKESAMRIILILTIIICNYCILDMFVSGIPLFSESIGRINYSRYSKLPFATKVNGEVTFFGIFVAGMSFFWGKNKKNKILSIVALLLTIFHRVLMEYKYQGLYNVIFAFALPGIIQALETKNYNLFSIKTFIKIFTVAFAFFAFSLITYSNVNKNFDPKELLFDRIFALQSHTFWELDDIMFVNNKELLGTKEGLNNEIYAVTHNLGQLDKESGIIRVMYEIGNKITVDKNIQLGVRWSGNYITVGINTVGYYFTTLISLILGILVVFDLKMFYSSMKNYEFICLYFSQSFMWDLLDYFRIGNWCILLNFKTMIVLFGLIYIYKKKLTKIQNGDLKYE